jgi:hypothetical protein
MILNYNFEKKIKKYGLYYHLEIIIPSDINNFSYTFENYKHDLLVKKRLPHYIIKVWSGR